MADWALSLLAHQQAAIDKIGGLKVGALFMEMGTGKTRTALEIAVSKIEAGRVRRLVWICPCAVRREIAREAQKHLPGLTTAASPPWAAQRLPCASRC